MIIIFLVNRTWFQNCEFPFIIDNNAYLIHELLSNKILLNEQLSNEQLSKAFFRPFIETHETLNFYRIDILIKSCPYSGP